MSKVVKLGTQLVPDAQQGRRCQVGDPGPLFPLFYPQCLGQQPVEHFLNARMSSYKG